MPAFTAVFLTVLAVVCLPACGGDDPVVNFSQDDDTEIKSLSAAEVRSMCEEAAGAVADEMNDLMCTALAIQQALTGGGSCEIEKKKCLADPPGAGSNLSFDPEETCATIGESSNVLDNCTATVGEYETCINETVQLARELLRAISCSSSLQELSKLDFDFEPPVACDAVVSCGLSQTG